MLTAPWNASILRVMVPAAANEAGLVHAYPALRIVNIADDTNGILRLTIWQQRAKDDREL